MPEHGPTATAATATPATGTAAAAVAAWTCYSAGMWSEPYLETCCRSALHRLALAGPIGRPPALKDGRCLDRLAELGLAEIRADGWFVITAPARGPQPSSNNRVIRPEGR